MAVSRGATVAVRRRRPRRPRQFSTRPPCWPTWPPDARILKEEVFRPPSAPIAGFDTEEEGLAAANDTEYGLAAYILHKSRWTGRCAWAEGLEGRNGRGQSAA